MTSTRRTIPAPPPNGVSSTWPHFKGVDARKSKAETSWPRASAFCTWRWVMNHSNHCGNSVKTSAFTEEAQIDVDAARRDVDRAHAVAHQRHEQLRAVGPVDLESRHARQRAHLAHVADFQVAVDDQAAFEVRGPELVVVEHRVVARDGQLETPQRLRVLARVRAFQAQDRAVRRAGATGDATAGDHP